MIFGNVNVKIIIGRKTNDDTNYRRNRLGRYWPGT